MASPASATPPSEKKVVSLYRQDATTFFYVQHDRHLTRDDVANYFRTGDGGAVNTRGWCLGHWQGDVGTAFQPSVFEQKITQLKARKQSLVDQIVALQDCIQKLGAAPELQKLLPNLRVDLTIVERELKDAETDLKDASESPQAWYMITRDEEQTREEGDRGEYGVMHTIRTGDYHTEHYLLWGTRQSVEKHFNRHYRNEYARFHKGPFHVNMVTIPEEFEKQCITAKVAAANAKIEKLKKELEILGAKASS
jgi:hypothetical protein